MRVRVCCADARSRQLSRDVARAAHARDAMRAKSAINTDAQSRVAHDMRRCAGHTKDGYHDMR